MSTLDLTAVRDLLTRPLADGESKLERAEQLAETVPGLVAALAEAQRVVDAAEAWRAIWSDDANPFPQERDLIAAVDARRALGHTAPGAEQAAEEPRDWLVWSHHHSMWWRAAGAGYTSRVAEAGRYTRAEAEEACGRRSWDGDMPGEVAIRLPQPNWSQAFLDWDTNLMPRIEAATALARGLRAATRKHAAPAEGWKADHTPVVLHLADPRDTPKTMRETLCVAQTSLSLQLPYETQGHRERIGRIIAEIDRQRPLGPDGKHGNLHTPTCGCEPADGSGEGQRERHGYTSHGHPCCPNASREAPAVIARCGGPALCGRCGSESARLHGSGEGQEARA